MCDDSCMYVCCWISYISDSKETQACRLVASQVPVYILRPMIRMQLHFAYSFGAFLRTSAPSDTFGNLLRYYEVPPYSLPYTLSEAHVTVRAGKGIVEPSALGRRFFITERGHFGLAPPEIKGDKIIFFIRSSVPFVVRGECGKDREEGGEWRIVGETYVQGLMNREIIERMREGEASLEVLKIV